MFNRKMFVKQKTLLFQGNDKNVKKLMASLIKDFCKVYVWSFIKYIYS